MAITRVQSVQLTLGSGSTYGASVTTTAGNTLVITVETYQGGNNPTNISSISDDAASGGNTWQYSTAQQNQNPPVAGSYSGIYWGMTAIACCIAAKALTAASPSVSITLNAAPSVGVHIYIHEFAGVPAGASIDAAASSPTQHGSATTFPLPAITLGGTDDLVIGNSAEESSAPTGATPAGFAIITGTSAAWDEYTSGGSLTVTLSGGAQIWMAGAVLAIGVVAAAGGKRPLVVGQAVQRAANY